MKLLSKFAFLLIMFSGFAGLSSLALAEDFAWMKDFNIKAEADADGVRVRLATTFKLNDTEIDLVWSNTKSPAEATVVVALADISDRPVREVVFAYQRANGWGQLAKSLGIKPGSQAFHALKTGQHAGVQNVLNGSLSVDKTGSKGKGKN